MGRICIQLVQSGLPFSLWRELVAYSSVQLNSSPSVAINNCTPVSLISPLFKGHYHPVKATCFKPFGCQAYVLNHNASKLQPTDQTMIMVGLEPGSNAYRLWDKGSQRIVISADIRFNELHFPATGHSLTPPSMQIVDNFPDMLATMSITENVKAEVDQTQAETPEDVDDSGILHISHNNQELTASNNNVILELEQSDPEPII